TRGRGHRVVPEDGRHRPGRRQDQFSDDRGEAARTQPVKGSSTPMEAAMVAKEEAGQGPAELANAILRQIVQRAGARIQSLAVEVSGDRVVIRGRAASFHLKQLALQGAVDVLGRGSTTQIELDVQVVGPPGPDEPTA